MAPLTKATAACVLAVCSATFVHAVPPTATKTPDSIAVTVNLARRGKLDVLIEKVAFDATIADAVATDIPTLAGDSCANIETVTPAQAKGVVSVLEVGEPDWVKVIQGILDAGLGAFSAYPTEPWSDSAPWNDAKKANVGYLLWSTSTKIGCAYTKDCPSKNFFVCRFTPTAAATQHPFSAEYYAAVKARTIPLSEMGPSDVDGNPKQSGTSAFNALPSLLLGCIGVAVSFFFA